MKGYRVAMQADQTKFANSWLKNIKAQQNIKPKARAAASETVKAAPAAEIRQPDDKINAIGAYKRLLGTQDIKQERVYIWEVNGELVRKQPWGIDFNEGSNHYKLPEVPENKVIIDDAMEKDKEVGPVIVHELTERGKRKFEHIPYATAHADYANPAELSVRNDPSKLAPTLKALGFEWAKGVKPGRLQKPEFREGQAVTYKGEPAKVELADVGGFTQILKIPTQEVVTVKTDSLESTGQKVKTTVTPGQPLKFGEYKARRPGAMGKTKKHRDTARPRRLILDSGRQLGFRDHSLLKG